MAAPVGRKTRPQGDQELVHTQSGFLGGMSTNNPASSIEKTEVPLLENLVPLRTGIRTRGGVKYLRNTGLWDAILQLDSGQIIFARKNESSYAELGYLEFDGAVIDGGVDGDPTILEADVDCPAPSGDIKQLYERDGRIWIRTSSELYTVELDGSGNLADGYYLVPRTSDVPNIPCVTSTGGAAPALFRYRYTVTGAIVKGGVTLAESGSVRIDNPLGVDYVEVENNARCSSVFDLNINWADTYEGLEYPAYYLDFGYTHIKIYRTKELNGQTIYNPDGTVATRISAADENQYWFCGTYDIATGITTWAPIPSGSTAYMPQDKDLFTLLASRFNRSIPSGISEIMLTAGLLFAVKGRTIYYSPTAELTNLGNYVPGAQELNLPQAITALRLGADSMIITCNSSTHLLVPSTSVQAGDNTYGESIPLIVNGAQEVDAYLGVVDPHSIFQMSGYIIARCSDGTIRQFAGSAWGPDMMANTLSRHLRTVANKGQTILARPDGVIYYWCYLPGTSTGAPTDCYRMASSEDKGFGTCKISGDSFPFVSADRDDSYSDSVLLLNDGNGNLRMCVHVDGELLEIENEVTYGDEALVDDAIVVNPFTPRVSSREVTGTSLTHFVEHEQTNVFFHPIPGTSLPVGLKAGFTLYADGGTTASQEIPLVQGNSFAVFSGGSPCSRFRVQMEFSAVPFFIPEFSIQFRSRDERVIGESTTAVSVDRILQGCSLGMMDSGNSLYPSDGWEVSGYPPLRVAGLRSGYDAVTVDYINKNIAPSSLDEFYILYAFNGVATTNYGVFNAAGGLDSMGIQISGSSIRITTGATLYPLIAMGALRARVIVYLAYNPLGLEFRVYSGTTGALLGTTSATVGLHPPDYFTLSNAVINDFRMYPTALSVATVEEYVRDMVSGQFNYHKNPRRSS